MVVANAHTLAEAFAFTEAMAQDHVAPGVLVFTGTLRLLYMSQEARELTSRLQQARIGRPMQGVVPDGVLDMCEDLVHLLRTNCAVKDWEQHQRIRVTGAPQCPVLLRGFAIPHGRSLQGAHLIILMEPLCADSDMTEQRLQERYHLTDREQTLIIYLMQGLTNKEIANWMEVGEHTIKAHLKHLMKKTHTTTRTGLLTKVIFAAAAPPALVPTPALHKTSAETGRESLEEVVPTR